MKEEQKVWPWAAGLIACVLAAALLCAWFPLQSHGALPAAGSVGTALEEVKPAPAAAEHPAVGRTVVPLGRAVGIKLFSDGVMVVGFSEIATEGGASVPARDCGLKAGDIITHINSSEVDTIEQVQQVLQEVGGDKMSIRATRGEKQVQVTAQAVQCSADGQYKLGAWIRDSMAGIGTMTFYDPESGVFGALGHGINDVDTALLMPLESGSIMYAEVTDVQKGESGAPGELHGAFQVSRDLGALYANTQSGVFGTLSDEAMAGSMPAVEVASRSEVKTGKATILSNITGDKVEEYAVEITRVYPAAAGETRNLMLKVTDPRLLEATGGIVQGMSGSPILQNGKLVGAVTHVLVNDPTQGYGILAENMTSAAGAA
ncbi:SpoIVB peptidase [Lawsonibacter celer]|jgi:stage IV sporulation protein B|uniref:SpoIVB peptidase n=1 Tax=Lawsonibacter celer TaxID=2986526 RepID=UPI001647EB38|nr:SpoIVB peptidase [Lawsonibacter celer]